jgi:hypothetical protein
MIAALEEMANRAYCRSPGVGAVEGPTPILVPMFSVDSVEGL